MFGNFIILNGKNIKTKRLFKKLNNKLYGFYKIIKVCFFNIINL